MGALFVLNQAWTQFSKDHKIKIPLLSASSILVS